MIPCHVVFRRLRPRIARVVAVILLTWTGADLVNAQLCAADQVPATSQAAAQHDSERPDRPAPVDDCFCCSHTVQLSVVLLSDSLEVLQDRVNILRGVASSYRTLPLDHPPQLLA